ncbi:helix-turn-helix domain-containing protein [Bradyrhizobium sp. LMG 9283]|uniref:helix-turn-helix domain-containing protein n=1 Tax=Bradyrhizobium sp. LMG 9283 TaxID=592064 RepID=UPI00388DA35A
MTYGSHWSEAFLQPLSQPDIRKEFVADQVRARIAQLIRVLREQPGREWTQAQLAERAGTSQNVISRFEDPNYGKMSLQSLLEIAAALDVPVWIDFPEWSDWLAAISDFPNSGTKRSAFDVNKLMEQGEAVVVSAPLGSAAASAAKAVRNMLSSQPEISSIMNAAVNENATVPNRPSYGLLAERASMANEVTRGLAA